MTPRLQVFRAVRTSLLTLLAVVALTSCSNYFVRSDFDSSLEKYNELLRWHEVDKASQYASESIIGEYTTRAKKAKETRVVDYRVLSTKYDTERRKAKVEVDIDYYGLFSNKLKTVRDTQEWAYLEESGETKWRIVSPLPDFR